MVSVMHLAVEVGPGQSGPVGLVVILALCLLCVVLFRSMIKQLKRVPREFGPPSGGPAGSAGITRPDDSGDA